MTNHNIRVWWTSLLKLETQRHRWLLHRSLRATHLNTQILSLWGSETLQTEKHHLPDVQSRMLMRLRFTTRALGSIGLHSMRMSRSMPTLKELDKTGWSATSSRGEDRTAGLKSITRAKPGMQLAISEVQRSRKPTTIIKKSRKKTLLPWGPAPCSSRSSVTLSTSLTTSLTR